MAGADQKHPHYSCLTAPKGVGIYKQPQGGGQPPAVPGQTKIKMLSADRGGEYFYLAVANRFDTGSKPLKNF